MTISLRRSMVIIVGCAVGVGAGCSSDETASTDPIIVVETLPPTTTNGAAASSTPDSSGAGASSAPEATGAPVDSSADAPNDSAAGESDEEKLADFSQCMRDNGVEKFKDPIIQADGSANLFDDETEAMETTTDPEFNAAYEACIELLEGTAFLAGESEAEAQDDLVKLAACLRDRGIEVDDPDFDAEDPNDVFGADLDPNDPAVNQAVNECSQEVYTQTPNG